MSPFNHPLLIENWDRARWLIGWVFPLLFAVSTYRTVHQTASGFNAFFAAVLVFGAVYLFEVAYVVLASGDVAEVLGLVGDVACVTVPWMPLLGVQGALIVWAVASAGLGAAVALGRFEMRTRYVFLGIPVSIALAWCAGIVKPWAAHLAVPSVPTSGLPDLIGYVWVVPIVLVVVLVAVRLARGGVLPKRAPRALPSPLRGALLEQFLGEVKARVIDGPHPVPGHEDPSRKQALYALPREYGAIRLAVVANGTKNPATDEYEYVGLRTSLACRTVDQAIAETYGLTATEYARTERRQ